MENNLKSEEPLLRAFITGYTQIHLSQKSLLNALTTRYPYIKDVKLPNKKPWQGYAFVDFEKKSDFLNFIREKKIRLKEFRMNLVIKPHKTGKALKRRLKDMKKRKLKISNIPKNWDDSKLEEFFSLYGKVENCYVKCGFSNGGVEKKKLVL